MLYVSGEVKSVSDDELKKMLKATEASVKKMRVTMISAAKMNGRAAETNLDCAPLRSNPKRKRGTSARKPR